MLNCSMMHGSLVVLNCSVMHRCLMVLGYGVMNRLSLVCRDMMLSNVVCWGWSPVSGSLVVSYIMMNGLKLELLLMSDSSRVMGGLLHMMLSSC